MYGNGECGELVGVIGDIGYFVLFILFVVFEFVKVDVVYIYEVFGLVVIVMLYDGDFVEVCDWVGLGCGGLVLFIYFDDCVFVEVMVLGIVLYYG